MAAGTEVGKYRLVLVLFLPLYTRLHKEEVLDNETRGMIRGCIYADPGIHYNEIMRRLKLSNGMAAHHLMTLEREGFIRSWNDGRLKRFYPVEMKLENAPVRLSRLEGFIFNTIREQEGMSQSEIARVLELSNSIVHRQITRMAASGVLRLERHGLAVRCYIADGQKTGRT